MKLLSKILTCNRKYKILLILMVIFLSFGQTLKMYFWQDDSALIFKLQNPSPPAGSFGPGIIGEGPYKYLVALFVPFYSFFQLNPFGYFAIGLLTYTLATLSFWFFVRKVFEDKKAAFLSTIIFSAGYVGSDTMFRIINSWQTNLGLIFFLLSLAFLADHIRKGKSLFYFLSFCFYVIAIKFIYIRSHSLILPILVLDLLFVLPSFQLKKIFRLIIRQIPFLIIFYLNYINKASMAVSSLSKISFDLLTGKIEILSGLFATLGNVFIPSLIQEKFLIIVPRGNEIVIFLFFALSGFLFYRGKNKAKIFSWYLIFLIVAFLLNRYFISKNLYWYRGRLAFVSGEIGLFSSGFIIFTSLNFWRRFQNLAILLLFAYGVILSQAFSYYIQYPDAIFTTTHRYLSYSFVGYAIIFGGLSSLVYLRSKKLIGLIPFFLLVFTNIILSMNYQKKIIIERSNPTRNFYKTLLQYEPQVNQGAIFYFDIKNDSASQNQFRDFFSVGSMPESTALAIYYQLDRSDITLVTDFEEALALLAKNPSQISNLYSFFYGDGRLLETTNEVRKVLTGNSINWQQSDNEAIISSSPILVQAKIKLNFKTDKKLTNEQRKIIDYSRTRERILKKTVAKSLSEWRYQEIENLIDGDRTTSWRGHRIYWHDNNREEVILDLGEILKISRLVWVNWSHYLTPTSYTIYVSSDSRGWTKTKEVKNGPERKDGEVIIEDLENLAGRYLKIIIEATTSEDSPALSEIEVIEEKFDDINLDYALAFLENPTPLSKESLGLAKIKFQWQTEKGPGSKILTVGDLDKDGFASFIISPGGIKLKEIKAVSLNDDLTILSSSFQLKNLTFKEIVSMGLIRRFSEN